jgi:hypothetical protein
VWGKVVVVGDVVSLCGFMYGLRGKLGQEEVDGVYPLWFPVASEEFLIEEDVTFGEYSCCWTVRWPFNSTVDLVVIEAFVYVAAIAGDPSIGRPAVDVAVLWVCRVREEIHGGLGDAFRGSAYGALVGADKVALSGEKVAEVGTFGVVGVLRTEAKEAHSGLGVRGVESGWGDCHPFSFSEGVGGVVGSRGGLGVGWVSIGAGWGAGEPGMGLWEGR